MCQYKCQVIKMDYHIYFLQLPYDADIVMIHPILERKGQE